MSLKKSRRQYDPEFKHNAVQLSEEPNRTVVSVARRLGIPESLLHKWRKAFKTKGTQAFPGNGKEALTSEQKRIRELEKHLRDAEMERDILKKALGIFSKQPKGSTLL